MAGSLSENYREKYLFRQKTCCIAKALYNNESESPDELPFSKGDILTILEQNASGLEGWWLCSLRGRQGICPGNRLRIVPGCYDTDSGLASFGTHPVILTNSLEREKHFMPFRRHKVLESIEPIRKSFNCAGQTTQNKNTISDAPELTTRIFKSNHQTFSPPIIEKMSHSIGDSNSIKTLESDKQPQVLFAELKKNIVETQEFNHENVLRNRSPKKSFFKLPLEEYDVLKTNIPPETSDYREIGATASDRSSGISMMSFDSNSSFSSYQTSESLASVDSLTNKMNTTDFLYDTPPKPRSVYKQLNAVETYSNININSKPYLPSSININSKPYLPSNININSKPNLPSNININSKPYLPEEENRNKKNEKNIPEEIYDVPSHAIHAKRSMKEATEIENKVTKNYFPDCCFESKNILPLINLNSLLNDLSRLKNKSQLLCNELSILKKTNLDTFREFKDNIYYSINNRFENKNLLHNFENKNKLNLSEEISDYFEIIEVEYKLMLKALISLKSILIDGTENKIILKRLPEVILIAESLVKNISQLEKQISKNKNICQQSLSEKDVGKKIYDKEIKLSIQSRPLPKIPTENKISDKNSYENIKISKDESNYNSQANKKSINEPKLPANKILPTNNQRLCTSEGASKLELPRLQKKEAVVETETSKQNITEKNITEITSDAISPKNCVNETPFQMSQLLLQVQHLMRSLEYFLDTVEKEVSPEGFIAHSKLVIIDTHKLMNIGDNIYKNISDNNNESKLKILRCTNLLCDAMKYAVERTKVAALSTLSKNTIQDMIDAFRNISVIANMLNSAIFTVAI